MTNPAEKKDEPTDSMSLRTPIAKIGVLAFGNDEPTITSVSDDPYKYVQLANEFNDLFIAKMNSVNPSDILIKAQH